MIKTEFLSGVIEGFYGPPWAWPQRHALIDTLAAWDLNTYLYAPKDDLKHRIGWRNLYTHTEAEALGGLIQHCQTSNVSFVYALAPGLDPEFSSATGQAALLTKTAQLRELGCTQFALLFDDIATTETTGQLCVPEPLARSSITMANRFREFLSACLGERSSLWFCPTAYCERMSGPPSSSSYLQLLGRELHPTIEILWTGPEIVSESIEADSIRALSSVFRRRPLLWDNLHANDYDLRRLYLGPYSGRATEVREAVRGILINPNGQFEANFVPIRTLALFLKAGNDWNPRQAYLQALEEWLPRWTLHPSTMTGAPITTHDLAQLCDCFYLPFEHGLYGRELLEQWRELMQISPPHGPAKFDRFVNRARAISALFDRLAQLEDRALFQALSRHLWELKEEMHLQARYLEWRRAYPNSLDHFVSGEHRPRLYRGGLVAELQQMLPMDGPGFLPAPSYL